MRWSFALAALSLLSAHAWAASPVSLADDSPRVRVHAGKQLTLSVGGYVETFYQWNVRNPQNGISEFRAFDNRHNAFSLQAIALDVGVKTRMFELRITPQAGIGPSTYYRASEPLVLGSTFTPPTDAAAWQHLQQAWLAFSPLPDKLTFDAGLFLSPIGVEGMATHTNHHWSHSVMFFALPFYHVGARVRWAPSAAHALRAGVYNGWNSVGDGNAEKTLGIDYTYSPGRTLTFGGAYFTGAERPRDAVEGRAFRHLFDLHAVWTPHERINLVLWANAGFEPNVFGVSAWAGGTASTRWQLLPWLFAATRFTLLYEHRAHDARGAAEAMLMPAGRILSRSLTLEAAPLRGLSLKLEARADDADRDIYFAGAVAGAGTASAPWVPNSREQTTFTLGATGWF